MSRNRVSLPRNLQRFFKFKSDYILVKVLWERLKSLGMFVEITLDARIARDVTALLALWRDDGHSSALSNLTADYDTVAASPPGTSKGFDATSSGCRAQAA